MWPEWSLLIDGRLIYGAADVCLLRYLATERGFQVSQVTGKGLTAASPGMGEALRFAFFREPPQKLY